MMNKFAVLFVCTENICRSPMAEGVLRQQLKLNGLAKRVKIDSAGTLCSQPGCKPDPRTIKVLRDNGVKLRGVKARRILPGDFDKFDFILAMDKRNHTDLLEICPKELHYKIMLFMEFSLDPEEVEVPDPYYGAASGFLKVFELINEANEGLVHTLEAQL